MRKLMKMIKWDISKIHYLYYYGETHVFLACDQKGCFIIQNVDGFAENSKIFREKTFGIQYGLSTYSMDWKTVTLVQVLKNSQYLSRLVFHNLIIDLFRNPPVIEYDVKGFNLSKLYVYEEKKIMRLSGAYTDAIYAEEYFSKATDLHCAIVIPPIKPRLNIDSKLTTAKYLYLEHALYNTRTLALYFNGHRAVFNRSDVDQSTIVEIIKKWKSNEGFQNLQTLEIYTPEIENFRVDEIVQQFDARPWDGLRRSENFEKEYRVMEVHFEPMECANFLDIVRDSDGKVASFLATETMFKFCIWN